MTVEAAENVIEGNEQIQGVRSFSRESITVDNV